MLISAQEAKTIVDRFVEPLDDDAVELLVRIGAEFDESLFARRPWLLEIAHKRWDTWMQP